jgi:hypothetical protein
MTKVLYAKADMVSMNCKESLQKSPLKLKYFFKMPIIITDSVNESDSFWVRDCLEIDIKKQKERLMKGERYENTRT